MADTLRLRRIRRAILLVGFAAAIVIYVVAGPDRDDASGYDPMQNKMYLHDLELYGGKANLLAVEFRDWFVGLWQGRNLAFTVAFLTVLVVLIMRFAARYPPEEEEESAVVHRGPWRDGR
jgi:hypothetical protein